MKLPFDEKTRAELVNAARLALGGGIESTPFWQELMQELNHDSRENDPTVVELRKIKD